MLNTADLVTAFYALTLSIFLLEPGASGRVLVVDDLLSALDPVQSRSLLAGLERIRRAGEILAVLEQDPVKLQARWRWIEIGGNEGAVRACPSGRYPAVTAPQLIILDSREDVLWETAEWTGAPLRPEPGATLQQLLWSGFTRQLAAQLGLAVRRFHEGPSTAGEGADCGEDMPTWLEVKPFVAPTFSLSGKDNGPASPGDDLRRLAREMDAAARVLGQITGRRDPAGGQGNGHSWERALDAAEAACCLATWLRDWDLLPFALPDIDHVLHPAGVALYRLPEPWPAREHRGAALQGGLRIRRIPALALTGLVACLTRRTPTEGAGGAGG